MSEADKVRHLTMTEVTLLCRLLGDLKIRDAGLLDSALHRPQASFAGMDAYETVETKAAALLHSLAKNHALLDGNKRIAWMACVVFLNRNGYRPDLNHAQAISLVLDVAGGDMDVATIAARLNVVTV